MHQIFGREKELGILENALREAAGGKGNSILVSGEAGVGKTALIQAFLRSSASTASAILSGTASADAVQPFHIFTKALADVASRPIFEDHEFSTFTELFVINRGGMLLAQAAPGDGGLDPDIFSGMFSAVQDFVRDSFDRGGGLRGALGRLEYGNMKILVEHGQHVFLVAVIKGTEHKDMRVRLRSALAEMERMCGDILASWSGRTEELQDVRKAVESLASARFLVRKQLEGVSLEQERIRIADQVLDILVDMSRTGAVLVLLEDIHWADESSVFLMNYLARNIRDHGILVLATMRPDDGKRVLASLSKAIEERCLSEITLHSLGDSATLALINSCYPGNKFPEDFIQRLMKKCDGNPLFVIELLRQLESSGSIFRKDGAFQLEEREITLPSTIEDLVQERMRALSQESLAILEFASCIGPAFDAAGAISAMGNADGSGQFEDLISAGILAREGQQISFVHTIVHDVAYAGISARWKAMHHRKIGQFLESAHANDLDEVVYELATHFSRSNEREKAASYCVMAAEKAESSYALELAKDFYERALSALGSKGPANRERVHILEQLGGVCAVLGDYDAAITHLDNVLPHITEGAERARVLRKYGYIYNRKSAIDKSIEKLDEAFAALGDGLTPEHGRIFITQGNNWWYKGNIEKAVSYTDKAIALFEHEAPDERELADALRVKALILSGTGKHDQAIEVYSRSLDIYTRHKDERRMAAMLGNIGNTFAEKGEYAKSLEYFEKGLVLLRKLRHKHNIAVMSINMGATYYAMGETSKAMTYFIESADAFAKIGDIYGLATANLNCGIIHYQSGELGKALESLQESFRLSERNDNKSTMANALETIGVVYCELGDYERSRECFDRMLAMAQAVENPLLVINGHTNLADLNSESGDYCEAVRIATEGLRMARELNLVREGAFAERSLARALALSGKASEASALFDKARATFVGTEEPNEIAIIDYYKASMLASEGDAITARKLLEGALPTFERNNMKIWMGKARKLLNGLG